MNLQQLHIERFLKQPVKYHGSELKIVGCIDDLISKTDLTLARALQLPIGDTIQTTLLIADDTKDTVTIYATGLNADKLQSVKIGNYVQVKLKFRFGVFDYENSTLKQTPTTIQVVTGFEILDIKVLDYKPNE